MILLCQRQFFKYTLVKVNEIQHNKFQILLSITSMTNQEKWAVCIICKIYSINACISVDIEIIYIGISGFACVETFFHQSYFRKKKYIVVIRWILFGDVHIIEVDFGEIMSHHIADLKERASDIICCDIIQTHAMSWIDSEGRLSNRNIFCCKSFKINIGNIVSICCRKKEIRISCVF